MPAEQPEEIDADLALLQVVQKRYDVLARTEFAPVPRRPLTPWECSHGAIAPAVATIRQSRIAGQEGSARTGSTR